MKHNLKCWPVHFNDVVRPNRMKRKLVEIRKDDRPFTVGDVLRLVEYDAETDSYSGRWAEVAVSHCLRGGPWLPKGYVAMSIHLENFNLEASI